MIQFSQEQQIAFDKVRQGHNVFITGPGGSGKSALIRSIYEDATRRGKRIDVTALTGCAAVLLNCKARTLHSWANIGLGNGGMDELVLKISKNVFSKKTWKKCDILVVDEISMLSLKMFTLLDRIGQAIRKCSLPFGGIQLLFSGDFFQLPPVGTRDDPETSQFCFESSVWDQTFSRDCQISLVTIFRQTDNVFCKILSQIREGRLKKSSVELLEKHALREYDPDTMTVRPTKLFPVRSKVNQINQYEMERIAEPLHHFQVKTHTNLEMSKQERITRAEFSEKNVIDELAFLSASLEPSLSFKLGCQVMCVINITESDELIGSSSSPSPASGNGEIVICNGSQGKIVSFCEYTGAPRVEFINGKTRVMAPHVWLSDKIPGIGVSQVPLILAWALTIHKIQGATLDVAEIDVGDSIFECGQTYVALARVKNLEGLYLSSFDVSKICVNRKAVQFYEQLKMRTHAMQTIDNYKLEG